MPFFKAGDKEVAGNYRKITLGSCVAKVMQECWQVGSSFQRVILSHIVTAGHDRFRS